VKAKPAQVVMTEVKKENELGNAAGGLDKLGLNFSAIEEEEENVFCNGAAIDNKSISQYLPQPQLETQELPVA